MERRSTSQLPVVRRKRMWELRPIPPVRARLSHWLKRADTRVSRRFARELKQRNLIPTEWEVLRSLYQANAPSPVGLAPQLGMTKGGISKLIARLVRKRLVRKTVSEYDRRYRMISLTWAGEYVVPELASIEVSCDDESFRELTGKQRRRLLATLKRVVLPYHPAYPPLPHPAIPLSAMPPFLEATTHEISPATACDRVQAILDACAKYD